MASLAFGENNGKQRSSRVMDPNNYHKKDNNNSSITTPQDEIVESVIDIPLYAENYNNLTRQEKKIFGNVFCICLSKCIKDEIDKQFCSQILKNICGFLELDDNDFISIEPLLIKNNGVKPEPFLLSLNQENLQSHTRYFIVSVLRFIFLANEGYDARVRAAIYYLCQSVSIPQTYIKSCEDEFCELLLSNKSIEMLSNEDDNIQKRKEQLASNWNWKRKIGAGTAAVVGGAALLLTGGLAAPAVAAGFTALGSTAVIGGGAAAIGTFLASNGMVLTTLFGVSGASLTAYKINKRMADLKHLEFIKVEQKRQISNNASREQEYNDEEYNSTKKNINISNSKDHSVTLCICVRGWAHEFETDEMLGTITAENDDNTESIVNVDIQKQNDDELKTNEIGKDTKLNVDSIYKGNNNNKVKRKASEVDKVMKQSKPTSEMIQYQSIKLLEYSKCETYMLEFETEDLEQLAKAIKYWIRTEIAMYAGTFALQQTVFAALMTSFTWPAYLLKASDMVDNPWSISCNKAEKAGEILADVLLDNKLTGKRPVTLIGYSLSGWTIYRCLEILYERGEQGRGIVDEVVLIGCPLPNNKKTWETMVTVVGRNIYNCYSEKDWLLPFLCRATLQSYDICGVGRACNKKILNVNVEQFINGKHANYCKVYHKILNYIQMYDFNAEGDGKAPKSYDKVEKLSKMTFFQHFQNNILLGKKTITIRDKSENYYEKDSIVDVYTYEEKTWFCKLKILHIEKVHFSDLDEKHAKQENMTLLELKNAIQEIYPNETELFVISYKLWAVQ